ncbi:MAG: ABC transporter permease [Dehalococcoidia bacterium]
MTVVLVPDVSVGSYRVWQRNRDAMLRLWRTEFLGVMVEPFIVILALGLGLGRFVELESGQEYVQFLAPGLLAIFPMFAAVFECAWGSYVRLEMNRTFQAAIATPVSVDDVITGEILWGTTRSLVNASYILLVATLLNPWLHMIESPWAVLVVPVAVLPGLLFSCISICFASIARAMSQFSYFFNLVVNPMFWVGGAFFPFEEMPGWVQAIGFFIPLKHVVDLYRGFVTGSFEWSMVGNLAWLAAATALFYWLALTAMRRRLIH